MSSPKQGKREREAARNLAHQRWALAHDAKSDAAARLARIMADPESTPADIAEATEALSRATSLYREAEAAARAANY
ncbi:hypothetical protein GA0070609_4431 [Micromonospora echinaurantiaca]|uniref:Uncharacterized protein n=1 Tax=Micromonospora echinaurantiaca TaxID=47857 RepID=A0A1C5JGE8_9ACTN|nr:hypothetical protein [Micromonospora echinaurantiaca]SCG69632.1 hypothetical protein GA0070609_4431 [Micromonospora echinaurantiaca]